MAYQRTFQMTMDQNNETVDSLGLRVLRRIPSQTSASSLSAATSKIIKSVILVFFSLNQRVTFYSIILDVDTLESERGNRLDQNQAPTALY